MYLKEINWYVLWYVVKDTSFVCRIPERPPPRPPPPTTTTTTATTTTTTTTTNPFFAPNTHPPIFFLSPQQVRHVTKSRGAKRTSVANPKLRRSFRRRNACRWSSKTSAQDNLGTGEIWIWEIYGLIWGIWFDFGGEHGWKSCIFNGLIWGDDRESLGSCCIFKSPIWLTWRYQS